MLATAGSRYTYSANTLAYPEAVAQGAERIALVGMSCQASVPAVMSTRKAGKVARRLSLTIGLLCSKTFDDAIFPELFEARYGLARAEIAKINIKGVFQIWLRDGSYHEVPLKEGHAWTREGCKACPDFAAEHADIATGGIGAFSDWTLTIIRTEQGRQVIDGMIADGAIETRPETTTPAHSSCCASSRGLAAGGGRRPQSKLRAVFPYGPELEPRICRSARESRGHVSRTASSIGSVSLPVKVFCWLGWYEQTTYVPSGARTSTPCPNFGRGLMP